jgi:hypothetical protein
VACLGLGDYCCCCTTTTTTREETTTTPTCSRTRQQQQLQKTLCPQEEATLSTQQVCPICLSNYLDTPEEQVCGSPNPKCTHMFHTDCILKWLEQKPTCPCCRAFYILDVPTPTTTSVLQHDTVVW